MAYKYSSAVKKYLDWRQALGIQPVDRLSEKQLCKLCWLFVHDRKFFRPFYQTATTRHQSPAGPLELGPYHVLVGLFARVSSPLASVRVLQRRPGLGPHHGFFGRRQAQGTFLQDRVNTSRRSRGFKTTNRRSFSSSKL